MNAIHVGQCAARAATQAVVATHLTQLLMTVLLLLDNLLLLVLILVACAFVENKLLPATHGGSRPDKRLVDVGGDWDALFICEVLLRKLKAHVGASIA